MLVCRSVVVEQSVSVSSVSSVSSVWLVSVPTERLEAELCTWAGHIAAATCRWLLLVAEYDRRRAWEGWECVSMAQWLSIHVGMSVGTARHHVAVARRLGELPLMAGAFGRGELSYSRVRALCRVATPATEADWVELARETTASQLERIVADVDRSLRVEQAGIAERQAQARRVSWWYDDDGMCHLNAVLAPEVGAAFARLLGESVQPDPDELHQRRADAFAGLLARVDVADPDAARRPLVVVHTYPDGSARVEGGPPVPASTVLGLGGDETTATHHGDGRITYSRRTRRRTPSRSQRRHVLDRDRGCAFPGCRRTDHLQTHHIAWYGRDRGDTVATNLVALCPKHHRAVHRLGWIVEGNPETGGVRWRRPDGRVLDPAGLVPGGDPDTIAEPAIGADTIVPRSLGAPYDHELTVWILANHPGRPGAHGGPAGPPTTDPAHDAAPDGPAGPPPNLEGDPSDPGEHVPFHWMNDHLDHDRNVDPDDGPPAGVIVIGDDDDEITVPPWTDDDN